MIIKEMAYSLKLPYIKENSQMLIDEAKHTKMDYEEFLNTILKRELQLRKENGIQNRLRKAKFPIKKYLEDFDRNKYNNEFKAKFDELESLNFIDKKENIILIGTPGAGKTHYSIGLGIKACLDGKNVLLVSVPNLIIELKEETQYTISKKIQKSYRLRQESKLFLEKAKRSVEIAIEKSEEKALEFIKS